MTRRKQGVKRGNRNKNKKGRLIFFITLAIMVFVYYQVVTLFNHTFGNKVKAEDLKLYLWVNELISNK